MSIRKQNEIELVVAGALVRDGDKFLIGKRKSKVPEFDNKWELPGGCVEHDEKPEETTAREIKEELGVDIDIIRLIPKILTKWEDNEYGKYKIFLVCFEAKVVGGVPSPGGDEVIEVQWFTAEEIQKLDTLTGIKEFLQYI